MLYIPKKRVRLEVDILPSFFGTDWQSLLLPVAKPASFQTAREAPSSKEGAMDVDSDNDWEQLSSDAEEESGSDWERKCLFLA
jgi:hypothetical protein